MKQIVLNYSTYLMKCCGFGFVGALAILVIGIIYFLNNKPDLEPWHVVELDVEFTSDSEVETLQDYLDLESRLFEQLDQDIYRDRGSDPSDLLNRYVRGSLSDPAVWAQNWNQSYELAVEDPVCGVLLLHGLTDGPYSMRVIAESLHDSGAHVLTLRIPGHGTAPAALTETTWQDMAAAVRLGMRHLKRELGEDRPLHIVGYSNGGALALRYALEATDDAALPQATSLILLSPEIGITPLAGIGVWLERVGFLLRLDKLQWDTVSLEYDPFKYNSFPLNAGVQAHRLTVENRKLIGQFAAEGKLADFPRILAFQSIVDATVSASALIRDLFGRLPEGGHELVVYDVNRTEGAGAILLGARVPEVDALVASEERAYTLTLLTNQGPQDREVELQVFSPGSRVPVVKSVEGEWPDDVYSLSHIALPFSPEDPVYGDNDLPDANHIRLGSMAVRGERGLTSISANAMLRQRWNPFFSFQQARILKHIEIER